MCCVDGVCVCVVLTVCVCCVDGVCVCVCVCVCWGRGASAVVQNIWLFSSHYN